MWTPAFIVFGADSLTDLNETVGCMLRQLNLRFVGGCDSASRIVRAWRELGG